MFLTRQDLTDLTGYKRASLVCKWLAENRFRFEVGADGWPRVLVAQLEERQLSGTQRKGRSAEPNFAALEALNERIAESRRATAAKRAQKQKG